MTIIQIILFIVLLPFLLQWIAILFSLLFGIGVLIFWAILLAVDAIKSIFK